MSKTVDDRIVRMTFDSSKFQNGVKGVLDGLKSIDKSLGAKRELKGLDSIGRSLSDVTHKGVGGLTASLREATGGFSMMEMAASVALGNIASKAASVGMNMVKSLTLDPIMDGFGEYELKMNSIGTILTNTASHGTSLDDVNKALNELNEYSDKTIYNFAQMTDNIGKATAAGLKLEPAVDFVKGMANTAAAFGVDAARMAGATQQMTQALASGVVKAQDWMSMENAGMAGKLLQDKLIENAKKAGKKFSLAGTSFKGSLEQGWLTAEIFSKTMAEMANDDTLTKKAGEVTSLTKLFGVLQEAVGSGWAQTFEKILGGKDASTKLFTDINDAITNGLITPMTNAREAVVDTWLEMGGRNNAIVAFQNIWKSIGRIIGPIGEAFSKVFPKTFGETLGHITKGFRDLSYVFMLSETQSKFISDAFTGLFKIIDFGIRTVGQLLQPLKHVFRLFVDIWRLIGSLITAFLKMTYVVGDYVRELTVVKEAQRLFNQGIEFIQKNVDKFVKNFDKGAKNVRDFFTKMTDGINGLFGAKKKTDDVKKSIDDVSKSSKDASKSMDGVKTVGDFVAKSMENVKQTGKDVEKMFNDAKVGAENAADGFVTFLNSTKDYIMNSSIIARATETMTEAWETMCGVGDRIKEFVQSIDFSPIANTIQAVKDKLEPIATYIKGIFDTIVDAFKSVFDELDLTGGQLLALLGGFAAGFGVFKILGKISDLIGNILNPVGNLSDAAVGVLDGVRGCLEAYQNDLQADTLKKIGVAVLFLSGGLLILSQLEMGQVQSGLLGVVGILAAVVTSLAVLIKITSGANLKGFFSLSAAFISMSIAVMNMSVAIMLLSSLGMEKLATGLLGVAGGLSMMVLALGAVGTMTGSIVKGAFAMTLVANSLNLMYIALTLFAKMDVSVMNNSLMSIGMALGILVVACRGLNSITGRIISTSIGLTILSGALLILVQATKKFGELDPDVMFKGLMSISVIMAALVIFNKSTANSKMSFSMGAGMMGLAKAMNMLIKPITKFGEMNVSELAKGIGSLGLIMGSLTLMMNFMKPQNGMQLMMLSAGLILFSKAIKVFCDSAMDLNTINAGDLSKGLLNIVLAVGAIAIAIVAIPEAKMISLAVGIAALSLSLKLITKTIEQAGQIPFGNMLKGFIALAGGLLVLEGATRLTSQTSMISLGVGLSAIALGFTAMVVPINKLGSVDLKTIAKGLGSMLGMIGIFTLMNLGMAGMQMTALAIGITLMAGALTAIVLPLKLMGGLDLKVIGVGLLGIAAVLAILGGAAFLMTPLVPVLFGLASSIGLLGTGMLAAAGGLAIFSAGFAIFATTVGLFGSEVLTFIVEFGKRLPELVRYAGEAFVELLDVLGQNGNRIVESLTLILTSILDACIAVIPLAANAITNLIVTILEVIATNGDRIAEAGFNLIMKLLEGIDKYVTPVVDKCIEILITMATALVDNGIILIDAGITLIINLINGIADGIESNSEAFNDAVCNLIFSALDAILSFGGDFFKRGVGFVGDMIKGLFDGKGDVEDTSEDVAEAGVKGAEETKPAWKAAGSEFSKGVEKGIYAGKSGVVTASTQVARDAANAMKKELDINSPSKVTTAFGRFTSEGLAVGITKFGKLAERAGRQVAEDTARNIERPMNNIALLDGINADPVVRPILDLSNIKNGSRTIGDMIHNAAGSISSFGSINGRMVTNVGTIQNGNDNSEIVTAISKLRKDIHNIKGTTNIIEGITYDDGSAISNTLSDLVRMARVERRK